MDLDKYFIKAAAVGNMFEVQLSELALQRAQDEKVKQFAKMMVQDHTKVAGEIKQLAQSKGVQLPTELPEMKMEEIQIFQTLQGSDFDQSYLSCMKVAHAKDVAAFGEKSKHAKDAELKAWTTKTLPSLKMHKQHVMAMTGGSGDDAQTAGAKTHAEDDAAGAAKGDAHSKDAPSKDAHSKDAKPADGAEGNRSTSSSGTGARGAGSGTITGGGTSGGTGNESK